MADPTDVTLPITPGRIGNAVDAIVEKALPSPLGELCMPVGLMKRELTAYAGELVQAAYDDAAGIHRDARERLARHLYMDGSALEREAGGRWDAGLVLASRMDDYRRPADRILAVITGQEN